MNQYRKELIHVSVWPDIPQIEIYTKRGESFVARGDDARNLARWLRDNLVLAVLGPGDETAYEVDPSLGGTKETLIHNAKDRFKKGDRVKFSPRAPARWGQAHRTRHGLVPATDRATVVGYSTLSPEHVRVVLDHRHSSITLHHSYFVHSPDVEEGATI